MKFKLLRSVMVTASILIPLSVTTPTAMAAPVSTTPTSVKVMVVPNLTRAILPLDKDSPSSGDGPERVSGSDNTTAAENQLHADVAKEVAGNQYELKGGGHVLGNNIIGANGQISQAVYGRLSSSAQNKFVTDVVTAAQRFTDPSREDYDQSAATKPYDNSTALNWFRQLQRQGGMGSAMITALLSDTSPDLVGAHNILQPFNGPVNIILGILSIVIMMCFGITILLDLLYINIPFFQNIMDSHGGNQGASKINWVSTAAKRAVSEAEQSGKEPLIYYIKRKGIQSFFLALALLYLVLGQMWSIIGTALDLVSGFTNG